MAFQFSMSEDDKTVPTTAVKLSSMGHLTRVLFTQTQSPVITSAERSERLKKLLQTTKFTAPQPWCDSSPCSSNSSASSSSPEEYFPPTYFCDPCPHEAHDCRNIYDWDRDDCILWIAQIIYDSHGGELEETRRYVAKVWLYKGQELEVMSTRSLAVAFPKHHRVIRAQRDNFMQRCRACTLDKINRLKVYDLNGEDRGRQPSAKQSSRHRPH